MLLSNYSTEVSNYSTEMNIPDHAFLLNHFPTRIIFHMGVNTYL